MGYRHTYLILVLAILICGAAAMPAAAAAEDPWCRGVPGICITNVTSTAFTVSWTTLDAEITGAVNYGVAAGSLTSTACDDRGCGTVDETHHVTIKGLSANTWYYFEIDSDGAIYDAGGSPWMQKTGKSLTPGAPDVKELNVLLSDSPSIGAPGTLVYIQLFDADGGGTLGESAVFSTVITDPDGLELYAIDRIRNATSQAYFVYSDDDLIDIYADGQSDGYTSYSGTLDTTIPDLVLDECAGCYIYDAANETYDCIADGQVDATHTCQYCDIATERHLWTVRPVDSLCRVGSGDACDPNEVCSGSDIDCPADVYDDGSTVCRAGSGDTCDPDELCPGVAGQACPSDAVMPTTTVCRAGSGDVCDPDEMCTGVAGAICPVDVYDDGTTVCRAGSGDTCDPDELCTGTAGEACPADTVMPDTTVCRAGSGDMCDPNELCTGTAGATCPADTVLPDTTVCRAGSGDMCDPDELCTGAAGATCPADTVLPDTTVCRAGSGDMCDPDELCTGAAGATCPADTVLPDTTVCRAGSGDMCDPDELCTGAAGATCPADTVLPDTTVCRAGSGDMCDPDELCTGAAGATCPADTVLPDTTVCRAGSGDMCDPDELCTGTAGETCPTDTVTPDTTVCRTGSGDICDPDERCTGIAGEDCPIDVFDDGTTVCRAEADVCDVEELCPGSAGNACPADAKRGGETECRAAAAFCDLAEVCDGVNIACPVDVFKADGTSCDDSDVCTSEDECDGLGTCAGVADPGAYLQVLTPATGATLDGGSSTTVTWDYNNGASCDITQYHYDAVQISASIDGGATYPVIIETGVADNGSYAWDVPAINEANVRLKIEPLRSGTIEGADETDGDLTVVMPVNLAATYDEVTGEVTLSWLGGSADIYYGSDPYGAGGWTKMDTSTSPYTDPIVTDDPIFYRVRNEDGEWYSTEVVGKETGALIEGFTLITMPFEPAGKTAQDLLDDLNTGGTKARSIIRWDSGAQWWDIHWNDYPAYNNFELLPGVGYFVEMVQPSTWVIAGSVIKEPVTYSLGYEYNLLGFPTGEWQTAQAVVDAVDSQSGDGHSIYRWVAFSQWWDVHYDQYPTNNNFDVISTEGYFVRNDKATTFQHNPMDIAEAAVSGPSGFYVTWSTTMESTGWLLVGDDPAALTAYLETDAFDMGSDHSVTVTGLPAGTYYYKIVASGVEYDNRGEVFEIEVL